jgi:uncharacterized protein YbjT (DUF2867 family)
MADKKIIAVTGATGAQGGSLVRAILADKNGAFAARAITRDPNSEKAKALAKAGAEVVAANLDDTESLTRAFQGAYGAFCVTAFWEHFSAEKEFQQAGHMAKAARQAGLKHVIWSTLEDTRQLVPLSDHRMPTLQGKYKVPHFDMKGESDNLFREAGVPTTFLLASFYWENFVYFGAGPKPGPDGKLALTMPMGRAKLAGIASEDIGRCAYGIFKRGGELIGKSIGIAGEHLPVAEIAAAMSKALGREVVYNEVTPDVYRGFGFPGADDLGNMFQYYRDFETQVNGVRDVARSRELNPSLQSFDQWLAANKKLIPLE